MPFLKRQTNKKLNPQYVDDPSARNNFELITDNINEIFRRLDKQRWAISEESSGTYTRTGSTAIVKPPTLQVKLTECSGKKPILVFMRQKSEVAGAGLVTGGGFSIANSTVPGGQAVFAIGNATQQKIIHVALFGGGVGTVSNPISWVIDYPASAVMAFHETPEVGTNVYEIYVNVYEASSTLTIQDCDLVAVELF